MPDRGELLFSAIRTLTNFINADKNLSSAVLRFFMKLRADRIPSELSPVQEGSPANYPTPTHLDVLNLRDRRIIDHLPLVRAIAIRVQASMPVHVDLDDLIHAGVMGLIGAASKFSPAREVAFPSYAKHRIRGSILDELRRGDWASRDIRKRHKQLTALNFEFTAALQRAPTEQEIAERMGVNVERWRQMALELHMVGLISSSPTEKDESVPEFPAPEDTRPDKVAELRQSNAVLQGALGNLPDRYRMVVGLYYNDQMTMKEIGSTLNIKESRVSQIHKAALEKLGTALRATGVSSALELI